MGDNIYNQDPISVKRRGLNSEIQFANNGGDDLESHPNVYVTSDGGLNSTYFTGDGGHLSNVIGPGNVNSLAYFYTPVKITSADFITIDNSVHKLTVDGDLIVNGNLHSVDHVTTDDAIILLANNNTTNNDLASGVMLNRPGANVFYGVIGDTNNFAIGLTNDPEKSLSITMLDSEDFKANVYGSVAIKGNNQLLFTDNVLINTETSTTGIIAIGSNSNASKQNAIAIGKNSNANTENTIVLNASGSELTSTQQNALYIKPIRGVSAAVSNVLSYSQDGEVLDTKVISINGTDATITNNIVVYGTGMFENQTTSIQTDLTSNVLIKLDQLSNVVIDTPVDQHTLFYNGSNWINEYPQSTFIMAKKNDTGETISKGDAVYIVEAQNENVVKVSRAKAYGSSKMPCIGIAVEDFINNGTHPIVTFGKAKGIDTSVFEEGDILYVSNVVAGGLSNVKPLNTNGLTGPDLIQNVGFVVKKATNGTIKVTGVGRANDIPNAEILPDDSTVNYVYVNTSGNDLKKIDPQLLTTNVHTLEQVTSVGNTTSHTVYFQNDTLSFKADSNIEVGTANLFVDTTTGRVGIGTNAPRQRLSAHVNTDTSVPNPDVSNIGGSYPIAEFMTSNVTSGAYRGIILGGPSGGIAQQPVYLQWTSGVPFQFVDIEGNYKLTMNPAKTGTIDFYSNTTASTYVKSIEIGSNTYPIRSTRFQGSRGNMILEGDSSLSGNPKLVFIDTNTSGQGVLGFDGATDSFSFDKNAAIGIINNTTDSAAPLQLYSGSGGGCVKANRVNAFYEMSLGGTTAVNSRLYTVAGGVGGVSIGQGETAWSAVSDERFKINRSPVENSVQRLSNINVVNFNWNYSNLEASNLVESGTYSNLVDVVHTGVLAQQIINDFPLIVSNIGFFEGNENNPAYGVKYTDFVPTIIDAIGVMSSDATITNGLRIGDFDDPRKEGHMIELDGSGDYTNTSIIIHAYDTSNLEIGMSSNTEHYITASGENTTLTLSATSNVVIDASNVGIGKTSPLVRLDVNGSIRGATEIINQSIGDIDAVNCYGDTIYFEDPAGGTLILPNGVSGMNLYIINASGATVNVAVKSGESIDGSPPGGEIELKQNGPHVNKFICGAVGKWYTTVK